MEGWGSDEKERKESVSARTHARSLLVPPQKKEDFIPLSRFASLFFNAKVKTVFSFSIEVRRVYTRVIIFVHGVNMDIRLTRVKNWLSTSSTF